ncbi:MAG: stalk domain-containing protein [Defluviitaleaceae bacterium]|nr:stalk domain-containing protein [Defluviitaleaceae bacterium]
MGVDIVAPGTNIMSAVPNFYSNPDHSDIGGWGSAYRLASGTSMSAPIIAGAAALMLNAFPGATPCEVKARLMNTATMEPLAYGNYSVFHTGAGFVDIAAALNQQSFAVVPTYIPWLGDNTHFGPGNAPQTFREAPLSSLNFGVVDGAVSQPLTVQFNSHRQWQVEVTHGSHPFVHDAAGVSLQYQRLDNGDLVFTKHFASEASLNRRYDGFVILTDGDCRIALPFASFYGDGNPAPEPRSSVGIVRPIITSRTERDWVASPDHAAFSAAVLGFDDPMGTSLPTNLYAVPVYGDALETGHTFFLGQLMLPANVDVVVSRAVSAWGYNIATGEEDAALATGIWELRFAPQNNEGYAAWGSFPAGRFILENEGPSLTMDAINLTDANDPHYPHVYSVVYPRDSETVPVSGRIFSPSHELAIRHQIYSVLYVDVNTNAPAIYDYRFATYWLRDVGMAGFTERDGTFAVNVPYDRLSQFTAFGDARLPNNYALDAYSEDFVTLHIGIITMPMWGVLGGIRTNFVTLIYMQQEELLALGWDSDANSLDLAIDRFTPAMTADNMLDILAFEYRTEDGDLFTLNAAGLDVDFATGQISVSFHEIAGAIGQTAISAISLDIDAPEAGLVPQDALADHELFNSQVVWYPNHGLFHFDTEYTVTVTLWASGGVKFDDNLHIALESGTVTDIAVREDGLMAEIDIAFEETESIEAGYAIAILHVSDPSGLGSGPFMNFNDHAVLFDPTATMAPLIDRIQAGVEPMPPDFWHMFDRDMNLPYFFWDNPLGGIQHGQVSRILPAGAYDWMWTAFRTANTFGWGSLVMHPDHVYEFYLWVDWSTMTFGVDVTEYHIDEWRALDSAVPSHDLLSSAGEEITITFRGVLPSRDIGIFLGGQQVQAAWATSDISWHGTPHWDIATIAFPPNNTGAAQAYTVRLADGAGGWFALETTITVAPTVIERPPINRVVFDIRDQRATDFYQIFIDSTATANYRSADRENMRRDSFDIFVPYFLEDHANAVIIPGRHYVDLPVGRYSIGIANYWSNRISHIDFFNNLEIRDGHHYEFFVERWDIWPYWLNIDGVPVPRGVQAMDIPVPVAGDTVPNVVIARDAYTAVVTWYPDHDVFEPDTIYTAHVALTPVPGQILNYITNFTVQGSAGPVRNVAVAEDYAAFSVNFPMTDTVDTPPGQVRVTLVTPQANLFTSAFGVIGYQLVFNSAANVFPLSPADINPANGNPFFSALRNFDLWDIHMPHDAADGSFVYMNGRRSAFVTPGIYDVAVLSHGTHPEQGLFSFLSPAYGFVNSLEFVYGYNYTITMAPGSLQNLDVRRFDMAGNAVEILDLNFDPGVAGAQPPPPPACEDNCNCDAPCGEHCECDHTPPACDPGCDCDALCGEHCECDHGPPIGGLARLVLVSNPAGFVPFAAMSGLGDIQGYRLFADSTAEAFGAMPEINFGNVANPALYDEFIPESGFVPIGAEAAIYVEAGTFDIALVSAGTGPNDVPVIAGDIYSQAPGIFVLTVFEGMEIVAGHEYRFVPWGLGPQTAPPPPTGTPIPELMTPDEETPAEFATETLPASCCNIQPVEITPPRYTEAEIAASMAFAADVFSQPLVIYEADAATCPWYNDTAYETLYEAAYTLTPLPREEECAMSGLVTGFSMAVPAMQLQTLAPTPMAAQVTGRQFPDGATGDLVRIYATLHDMTLTTYVLVTAWDEAPPIYLTFEAGDGGSLTATAAGVPLTSPAQVEIGSQVLFAATPEAGYILTSWTVNGVALDHTNLTHAMTLREDATVVVAFARELSGDATLQSITLSHGALAPAFDPAVLHYAVAVANAVDAITIGAVPTHPGAVIVSGGGIFSLQVGQNTFTIVVRAQDGTEQTYTIVVTREVAPAGQPPVATPPAATPPAQAPSLPSGSPVDMTPTPLLPLALREPAAQAPAYTAPYDQPTYAIDYEAEDSAETLLLPLLPPPAPASRLTFTAGQEAYLLNGQLHTAVGAPFIDTATDRMMIPLRTFAEALGFAVEWDRAARAAIIHLPAGPLVIPADEMLPDGLGTVMMVDDRVFVPLRFVMYAFEADVAWDSANRAAVITW